MEVKVRLTPAQEDVVRIIAEGEGITIAQAIRECVVFRGRAIDAGVEFVLGFWLVPQDKVLPWVEAVHVVR